MKNEVTICFGKMLEDIKEATMDTEYVETYNKVVSIIEGSEPADDLFEAAYELHMCDADKRMPEATLEFLKLVYELGIENGDLICMNNMGSLYYTDRCGKKDYNTAMRYYKMAADGGYPLAASNLGCMYYYGLDTEVNYELAYKYFSMAALRGDLEGLYKVGDMFRYGYYVEEAPRTAYCMYNRAYDLLQGTADTGCGGYILKRMGDAVSEGIGVKPNAAAALSFYQSAEIAFYEQIQNGDPFAQKELEYVKKAQTKLRKKISRELPDLKWTREYAMKLPQVPYPM